MVGPSATTTRARSAPQRSMAAIVASRTPVAAPRQPAWATAMTPAGSSANSPGPQAAGGAAGGGGGGGGGPGRGGRVRWGGGRRGGRPGRLDRPQGGGGVWGGGGRVARRPAGRRRHARGFPRSLGGRVGGACPAVETRID